MKHVKLFESWSSQQNFSKIYESKMGEVHLMAQEAKNYEDFKAEFSKRFKIEDDAELDQWLKQIWDSVENEGVEESEDMNESVDVSELKTGQTIELSNGEEYIIDLGYNDAEALKGSNYIYIGNVMNYKDCYVAPAGKIASAITKVTGENKSLLDKFIARWDSESTTMKPWAKMKL